jgi:hypothetical protein
LKKEILNIVRDIFTRADVFDVHLMRIHRHAVASAFCFSASCPMAYACAKTVFMINI